VPAVTTDKPHPGTILTGAAVMFVLLRLLAVSHYASGSAVERCSAPTSPGAEHLPN
jgi:hypothetical protein